MLPVKRHCKEDQDSCKLLRLVGTVTLKSKLGSLHDFCFPVRICLGVEHCNDYISRCDRRLCTGTLLWKGIINQIWNGPIEGDHVTVLLGAIVLRSRDNMCILSTVYCHAPLFQGGIIWTSVTMKKITTRTSTLTWWLGSSASRGVRTHPCDSTHLENPARRRYIFSMLWCLSASRSSFFASDERSTVVSLYYYHTIHQRNLILAIVSKSWGVACGKMQPPEAHITGSVKSINLSGLFFFLGR